jgi:hypothetical protein
MKRKIIGFFVCMLLIGTAVSTIASPEDKENEILLNINNECCTGNEIKDCHRLMNEISKPLDFGEVSPRPTIVDTPDYFNWMDFEGQDWTSPIKDQGLCGSCWAFGAVGALECIINIREGRADLDVDIAEQYLLSCLPRSGNCDLGRPYKSFYYIMSDKPSGNNCNGIIPESCFPYKAIDVRGLDGLGNQHDPVLCSDKCANWKDFLIPISNFGKWYPEGSAEDIAAIKSKVMQDGPVVTNIMVTFYIHDTDNLVNWGFSHHDPDEYYSSSQHYDTINHLVVIVGWKDDPSIENGGYWILKNSWGTYFGYNGFFNLEYGSLRVDNFEIDWVDYNPDVIVNWKPNADAGGFYYGDVDQVIMFDARGSFDHEGEIISYEWDFGNGNHGSEKISPHIYDSQGVYPVILTVIDNDGNTGNDTTFAFIGRSNNPPSTPTIKGPQKIKQGVEHTYTFSATDPEGDDIYYFIEWGDMSNILIGPFPSGEEITYKHTWTTKTAYLINVVAEDEYDFRSAWTKLDVTMPKDKSISFNTNNIDWIFERFSNAFPIMKHLLKLTFLEV